MPPDDRDAVGDALAFTKAAGSGVKEGAISMVEGLWGLAKGGYHVATDPKAREQAWNTTKNLADAAKQYSQEAIDDPSKPYHDARDKVLQIKSSYDAAYAKAEANGTLPEFFGKGAGRGAFEVGMFAVGAGEAGAVAKAGEVANMAGKAGEAAELAGDVGRFSKVTGRLGETANVTGKAAEVLENPALRTSEEAANAVKSCPLNGYDYTVDAEGRVTQVKGTLTRNPNQTRNTAAQLKAGGTDRLSTDQGGHFIGRRFDGPTDELNHFAQDQNFNQGAYKKLENQWDAALKAGKNVEVDIRPSYVGDSLRPATLDVDYTIDGEPFTQSFKNVRGGK